MVTILSTILAYSKIPRFFLEIFLQDKEDALNGDEADSGSGSMPLSNTLKST